MAVAEEGEEEDSEEDEPEVVAEEGEAEEGEAAEDGAEDEEEAVLTPYDAVVPVTTQKRIATGGSGSLTKRKKAT